VGKGPLREILPSERSEVLWRSCELLASLLRLGRDGRPMKAKLLLLASLLSTVLAGLCYFLLLTLALDVGQQVLDYLDAVMEIAQLS
jgi:hypothetical protein